MRPVVEGPASNFTVGTTIGPYKVLSTAETVGFGEAFKVFNTVVGRLELMRIMPRGVAAGELAARRFLKEAKILRSLEHLNVVKSYDLVQIDEDFILTMEFHEGVSLEQLMAQQAVSLTDGLRYATNVLAGLGCAHQANIVHRCIAPSTILILPDGCAKIGGFTFAQTADDVRLTARGFAIGFVKYMSPEQVEGRRELDARSDLYSLGVVLYELITGRRPFQLENQFRLMQAHLKEQAAPPSSICAQISSELDAIVLKALSKDPEQRFQTAEEFRAALNEVSKEASD